MDNQMLLGLDFGGTKVAIATADPKKGMLKRTEIASRNVNGHILIKQALEAAKAIVNETETEHGLRLTAIGVGTFGVVFKDHVELAPNVQDWEKVDIFGKINSAFGTIPVNVENDVKAAALAELRQGALKGTGHGLYVNFGTGISAGFTLGNQVVRGHNGAAGEIAYLLKNKNEKEGFRAGIAPFEDYASGAGLSDRATNSFGKKMTAKDLFLEAENDEAKKTFLQDTFEEIGFQIANLAIAWNPEKIVFGGGMMNQFPLIRPVVEDYLQKFVPYQPLIEKAHFESDASLFGAIELAHDLIR